MGEISSNRNHLGRGNVLLDLDNYTLLKALNDEKAVQLIPVTIYVSLLIVAGLIGNSVTLYIYCTKFQKTPSNYFVIWLSVLDFLACFLVMPCEIIDMTRPYMFHSTAACKTIRFIQAATLLTPAFTIIVIAFDRHDKVFRPFKRMSNTKAKILNVVTLGIAVGFALPAIFVFGPHTLQTHRAEIFGVTCTVGDSSRGEIYTYMYFASVSLVFITTVILLAVLYGRLWREIRKRSRRAGHKICPQQTDSQEPEADSHELEETSTSMASASPKKHYFKTSNLPDARRGQKYPVSTTTGTQKDQTGFPQRRCDKVYVAAAKTTKIVFVVSMAFIISFLPFLVAKVVQVTVADVENFPSVGVEVLYNIATRSFFVNNAINPIIYVYLNPAFRRETMKILKMTCCRR